MSDIQEPGQVEDDESVAPARSIIDRIDMLNGTIELRYDWFHQTLSGSAKISASRGSLFSLLVPAGPYKVEHNNQHYEVFTQGRRLLTAIDRTLEGNPVLSVLHTWLSATNKPEDDGRFQPPTYPIFYGPISPPPNLKCRVWVPNWNKEGPASLGELCDSILAIYREYENLVGDKAGQAKILYAVLERLSIIATNWAMKNGVDERLVQTQPFPFTFIPKESDACVHISG